MAAVDEMLPDRGPVSAQQALRAAGEIRVWDGRATAWLVAQRLLEVVGFGMLAGGIVVGSVLVGQWVWIVAGAALLLLVWEGPMGRRAGAEPRRWPTRWRAALVTVGTGGIVLWTTGVLGSRMVEDDGSAVVKVPVLIAACYLLAPVLRWLLSLRRQRCTAPWPDGSQGYAVLAVLAKVQWMHPDRLAALTDLPRARCDEWVAACAARGLAVTARRRRGFLRNAEITGSGLARLDAWTVELTARAAGAQPCTDSTAPTSPDVSSARSASDVT
jgi:hypothetical protein